MELKMIMKKTPPPKSRSYSIDPRHILPMFRDLVSLGTVHLVRKKSRTHVVQLGRNIRQHAFDARDPLPIVDHPQLAEFLGCQATPNIVLPPIDTISLSGLGFVVPYALLAAITGSLNPKKIFEIGTFRGVGTLTMALNAPGAEIFTFDLPVHPSADDVQTLTKGDSEWVRLSRSSIGFAFVDNVANVRIHQLRGNSLSFEPPPELNGTDLCFIDGGHSFECVKADTETALKILSPGGVIVWDDYSWFVDGVASYLNELRQELDLHRVAGSQLVIYRDGVGR
jgi:predicted O-methyltransferase YrrM